MEINQLSWKDGTKNAWFCRLSDITCKIIKQCTAIYKRISHKDIVKKATKQKIMLQNYGSISWNQIVKKHKSWCRINCISLYKVRDRNSFISEAQSISRYEKKVCKCAKTAVFYCSMLSHLAWNMVHTSSRYLDSCYYHSKALEDKIKELEIGHYNQNFRNFENVPKDRVKIVNVKYVLCSTEVPIILI